jgi:hypothetical protein
LGIPYNFGRTARRKYEYSAGGGERVHKSGSWWAAHPRPEVDVTLEFPKQEQARPNNVEQRSFLPSLQLVAPSLSVRGWALPKRISANNGEVFAKPNTVTCLTGINIACGRSVRNSRSIRQKWHNQQIQTHTPPRDRPAAGVLQEESPSSLWHWWLNLVFDAQN